MRKFHQQLIASLVVGCMLLTVACSTKWITTAEEYIQLAMPAVDTTLQLLVLFGGSKIPSSDVQLAHSAVNVVVGDLNHLKVLIDDYNAASAGSKPGILAVIQTIIATTQSDLNQILPPLHISDQALQTKITASIAIVSNLVQEIAALVDTAKAGATPQTAKMAAKMDSPPQFKARFNKNLTAPTGVPEIDSVTPTLVLH